MHTQTTKRIIYDIIVFLSVLFLPWWVCLFLVVFGVLYFTHFYESIVVGLCIDLIYGTGMLPVIFTAGSIVLYLLFDRVKKYIRIHA